MKLAHRLDGPEDAPLLVLSNSLGTTTRLWEPQLDAFAARFRVLRHDHPGHGDSPVPDGPVSVEEIAGAVLGLVDDSTSSGSRSAASRWAGWSECVSPLWRPSGSKR